MYSKTTFSSPPKLLVLSLWATLVVFRGSCAHKQNPVIMTFDLDHPQCPEFRSDVHIDGMSLQRDRGDWQTLSAYDLASLSAFQHIVEHYIRHVNTHSLLSRMEPRNNTTRRLSSVPPIVRNHIRQQNINGNFITAKWSVQVKETAYNAVDVPADISKTSMHSGNLLHGMIPLDTKPDNESLEEELVGAMFMRNVKIGRIGCPRQLSADECVRIVAGAPCVRLSVMDEIHVANNYENIFQDILNQNDGTVGAIVEGLNNRTQKSEAERRATQPPSLPPNDPLFPLQTELHDSQHWSIRAESAWAMWNDYNLTHLFSPRSGDRMLTNAVAVIDTGCDIYHEDLENSIYRNPTEICDDGLDNDQNGFIDDCYGWNFSPLNEDPAALGNSNVEDRRGHGTAVTSIIASTTSNNKGNAGICWNCKVIPIKVGDHFWFVGTYLAAIDYAIGFRVGAINYSAGGGKRKASSDIADVEVTALNAAAIDDILVFVAAGNSACDLDEPTCENYPAKFNIDNLVVVGSSSPRGGVAGFSNWGVTRTHIMAPGVALSVATPNNRYGDFTGTSASVPVVVGGGAYIRSRVPSLSYFELKKLLTSSCITTEELKTKCACGGHFDLMKGTLAAGELTNTEKPRSHQELSASDTKYSSLPLFLLAATNDLLTARLPDINTIPNRLCKYGLSDFFC